MDKYITIPLSKNGKNKGKYEAIVSIEDADLADLNWTLMTDNKTAYYARRTEKNKTIRMHRVIMRRIIAPEILQDEQEVDHINGNGLDNRRENLRIATHSQNGMNKKAQSNNKLGLKGVSWHKSTKRFRAVIFHNGKHKHIGAFRTKEEAYAAYCEAAKELHGAFFNSGENGIKKD